MRDIDRLVIEGRQGDVGKAGQGLLDGSEQDKDGEEGRRGHVQIVRRSGEDKFVTLNIRGRGRGGEGEGRRRKRRDEGHLEGVFGFLRAYVSRWLPLAQNDESRV